jgi:dimethylargininase
MEREPIDIDLARAQHTAYERALTEMGARVIYLPDAVFVEDPLLVFDEIAIVARPGAASRRPEGASLEVAIAPFRKVHRMREPATMEGGDVMRIGRDVFVGLSSRTNTAGIDDLTNLLAAFGYRVQAVDVRGCLHLKSACCPLGDGRILANRGWLDLAPFRDYEIVSVARDEPAAANVLRIADTVLMPHAFPRTQEIVSGLGLGVRAVDISELMKAEAAITCSSVLFE